jgi:hypothetical protein
VTIDVGIIDSLLHPPLELLQVTDTGLFNPYGPGLVDFTFPSDLPGRPVYGVTWQTAFVADGLGRSVGVITEYQERVFQLVVFNAFHILGPTFAAEPGPMGSGAMETHLDSGAYIFQLTAPQGLSLYITPGFLVTLNWIVGFP